MIHEFNSVIYPVRLWVAITEDTEEIIKKFVIAHSREPIEYDNPDGAAVTRLVSRKKDRKIGVLIHFLGKESASVGNIAHEATHGSMLIWNHIGEDTSGFEANAYLVGWIADCVDKVNNATLK